MTQTDSEALPSFDGVADTFISLGALGSPAELHGMLCGRLCGGGRHSEGEWLASAREFLDTARPDPRADHLIADLYRVTLQQLRDEQLSIELLLPSGDTELEQRVMALSHWCQGFLNGFGTSGVSDDTVLSGDTADALRDFAALVQIGPESEDHEDSETDYQEIVEYIRLAALSIFMEIGVLADGDPPPESPTVH
ncbi:MAG: UPF0149 family protein [Cellvibrionaceae bacterium]